MGRGNGTQSRWRVKTGVELGPSWDDGAAVFLASTAQTLALSPLATAVLEELTRLNSGADANELVAVLADSAELAEVERNVVREALRSKGLRLRITPTTVHLRSSIPDFAEGLFRLYGDREVLEPGGFADFHIGLESPRGVRRWLRPQVEFNLDGFRPFKIGRASCRE